MTESIYWRWPKRIARVLELPEETVQEMRSKHSSLTLIALKLFPSSPMQNAIRDEYQRIAVKLSKVIGEG